MDHEDSVLTETLFSPSRIRPSPTVHGEERVGATQLTGCATTHGEKSKFHQKRLGPQDALAVIRPRHIAHNEYVVSVLGHGGNQEGVAATSSLVGGAGARDCFYNSRVIITPFLRHSA